MKKLFMFLAVAGLATFGASCSSDDSSSKGGNGGKDDDTPPVTAQQLVLSADKTAIKVGEAVKFTVKAGKDVVDADVYIQGTTDTKISNSHTFNEVGEFKVIAKKKDFKDSSVVTIKVTDVDGPQPELELTLTPSKTEAFVGELITFTAKDSNGANVTGFTVKQADGTAVPNGLFSATVAGTYKFVASKEGYTSSEEASVVIKELPPVDENNAVKVGELKYAVLANNLFVDINANGAPILYTDSNSGVKFFWYSMVSNTGEESLSLAEFALIVPDNTTSLVYPKDLAADKFVLQSFAYLDGDDVIEASDVTALSFTWGVAPTETTPGKVTYNIVSPEFSVKVTNGDYGVRGLQQQQSVNVMTAKKSTVAKKAVIGAVKNLKK